jgi:hypothetical protein
MRRKPNAEERRRNLCGTTSFYYQTRSALLRGATDRVVRLDLTDFTAAMIQAKATRGDKAESLLSQLAVQAMRTTVEPERARARFELLMLAACILNCPPCFRA